MTYAVIDIGTNSTRLYIAEVTRSIQHALVKELETTRLGEGSSDGILKEEPMERTASVVAAFTKKALHSGAEKIYIYATAAVREALNKDVFALLIKNMTGYELDIISGETEAYIAYLGAAEEKDNRAVIDIGGGSTEVIIKSGDIRSMSLKLGAVRMMEKWGRDQMDDNKINEAAHSIDRIICEYNKIAPCGAEELIGVSGTPTTIASIKLGLDKYQPECIQGLQVTLPEIQATTIELCKTTLEKRKQITGMPPDRADVLQYGSLILWRFMLMYGYDRLTVSDNDSLKGYINYITLKGGMTK